MRRWAVAVGATVGTGLLASCGGATSPPPAPASSAAPGGGGPLRGAALIVALLGLAPRVRTIRHRACERTGDWPIAALARKLDA